MTLEELASLRGFTLRRGRRNPDRVWLVRDGALFTKSSGTDEATARALLAPANPSPAERV